MERVTYISRIKPELKDEYKKMHDEIWPEVEEALRKCGVKSYTLSYWKEGIIFAYCEMDNFEEGHKKFYEILVAKRWMEKAEKFIVGDKEHGPDMEKCEEMWHME